MAGKAKTALEQSQKYETRLTTAETNAAKAAALVPRVEILEKTQAKGGLRNNSLGARITTDQYNDIHSGTFATVGVGSYWQLGDFNYVVVATDCCTPDFHHAVIMPEKVAFKSQYSLNDNLLGGYKGSRVGVWTRCSSTCSASPLGSAPATSHSGCGTSNPTLLPVGSPGQACLTHGISTTRLFMFGRTS